MEMVQATDLVTMENRKQIQPFK